jgi:hypothetical protein
MQAWRKVSERLQELTSCECCLSWHISKRRDEFLHGEISFSIK